MAPWTVVIPVKSLSTAKSRLADATGTPADLALAFLGDTLEAVAATPAVARVVVVTSDPVAARAASGHGAVVVDDTGHAGINAAARLGAGSADPGSAIAIVVSDLPCLTPASLTAVLGIAGLYPSAFLPDLDGSGTTMWLAAPGEPVTPRFGPDSRALHRDSGCVDLVAAHPDAADALQAARTDVDTRGDLDRALAADAGPRTRAAARNLPDPAR